MKIKNITKHKHKLFKLKLIKTKVFKTPHTLTQVKIENIENRLKKALHIIYRYHINNKRIIFVGNPLYLNKKMKTLITNTKHILIPESLWINGILTNKLSKNLSKNNNNKISKILFNLNKKDNLMIIFNKNLNINALEESYRAKFPIISLNNNCLNIIDAKSNYKIPGNFIFTNKKVRDNFFCSLLISIIKKANQIKQRKCK
jgi:ribosomal protein S2